VTGQRADLTSFRQIADVRSTPTWPPLTAGSSPDTAANCASATACCEGRPSEDPHFGTTQIEVRLAYGPLRPPVRMRLEIEPWSPTATALELIPCQRVRPSAAYFAATACWTP
jgi:hypothetical protein